MSEFERCWPWLAAAIEHYGHTHEKEHVIRALESGEAQLHPLPHAAITTSIQTHPTGLKEGAFWLAGGDLEELVAAEPIISVWLQSEGCDRVVIRGRKGWGKVLPGYKEVATILVKDLK